MSKDPQADLEEILGFFEGELDLVNWYSDWYKKHANHTKVKYLCLRIPLIVLGVIVPQLIAVQAMFDDFPSLTFVAIATATLVAILAGLDTFFHWGELYVDDKGAELSLYAISRKYGRERLNVNLEEDPLTARDKAEKMLDALRSEYEQVVGVATGAFLKRATTTARKKPGKTTT